MTEAGYDPYAGRRFWASMKAEEDREFAAAKALAKQTSPTDGLPRVPEHKQTHPLVSNTIQPYASYTAGRINTSLLSQNLEWRTWRVWPPRRLRS